jgi:hypothetical protein
MVAAHAIPTSSASRSSASKLNGASGTSRRMASCKRAWRGRSALGKRWRVRAGVYYLLGAHRQLLYVGKANDLDRRLADHARDSRWWGEVVDVRVEVLGSERAALLREADVIVALQPPRNKSIRGDDFFAFVTVGSKGLVLGREGEYGVFPHLGRGAYSLAGRSCIDGFKALDRIVRATAPDRRLVHALLSGTSDRLLRLPLDDIEQPHVRHGIERDRVEAKQFFEAGPKAMRRLRLRHAGKGLVSREQFCAWIRHEVDEVLA